MVKAKAHKTGVTEALAWDDLTGMRLDGNQVVEARQKEIEYVRKMKVWTKIPRRVATKKPQLESHPNTLDRH